MVLPTAYEERMKRILGEDYPAYLASFEQIPERAFHINKVKISEERFAKISPFMQKKAENREDCFLFSRDGIGKHPFHHAGMIYIQEPAAMFPVEGVEILPDWKVLDMCAAPGGKSSQVMQRLGENGHLVSNEIIPSRCKMLTGNFERLGFRNAAALCASPKDVAARCAGMFDLVVCDAPCSGEGMFRKEENAIPEWSEKKVLFCAERQREVLSSARKCVKPGGYLLYSTCTFSEEENEENVMWFLREFPEFGLVPMKENINKFTAPGTLAAGSSAELVRRFYPHLSAGEGQFAALFRNVNGSAAKRGNSVVALRKPDKAESELVRSFLSPLLSDYDADRFRVHKDKLVYCDPSFAVPSDIAYMTGVTVGTFKKGRIEPHHQFFSAFGAELQNRIELSADDERLKRYLHGESFAVSGEKGWYAVLTEGCSIGGGKLVDGYLKNNYPRGLQNI